MTLRSHIRLSHVSSIPILYYWYKNIQDYEFIQYKEFFLNQYFSICARLWFIRLKVSLLRSPDTVVWNHLQKCSKWNISLLLFIKFLWQPAHAQSNKNYSFCGHKFPLWETWICEFTTRICEFTADSESSEFGSIKGNGRPFLVGIMKQAAWDWKQN